MKDPTMTNTLRLGLSGMTCPSCARHIEEGLRRVRGVRAVRVDYGAAQAEILTAPEGPPPAALIAAVEALGYGAALQPAAEQAEPPSPRPPAPSASPPAGASCRTEDTCREDACTEECTEDACTLPTPALARGRRRLVIIGSGGAGTAAALRAAEAGMEVSVIERGVTGGTCVNVGCVPSKILIAAARIQHHRTLSPFDAALPPAPPRAPDAARLQEMIGGRVALLRREKYETLLATLPHTRLLRGAARFTGPNRLEVIGAEEGPLSLPFDYALIATGARPALPALEGLETVPFWTSDEAVTAAEIPESLVILGGGNVAVELAQAFARLGSRVHLITRRGLLPGLDPAIGQGLAAVFAKEGITLHLHTTPQAVRATERGVAVRHGGGEVHGARLLVATGRRPATAELGLETLGVARDAAGAIVVDPYLRTSLPGLYAAGDCTTLPHYVYVAAKAGSIAVHNMLAAPGAEVPLDLAAMPAVVFTDPEIATVGLTEEAARRAGHDVAVRELPLAAVPRALANFETEGFIKMVAEAETGRLLGVQALAAGAGEFITTAALALRAGLDAAALADMLFPYLTMAEGLKLAAQSFTRDVARLSCCAA